MKDERGLGQEMDGQLREWMHEWTAPAAPASLEARVERARMPWWRRAMTASVPVPVAVALTVLAAVGTWTVSAVAAKQCLSAAAPVVLNCVSGLQC